MNANVYIGLHCSAGGRGGAFYYRPVSGTVGAKTNQGDVVFIRTHSIGSKRGNVVNSIYHRTAFAGWSLF